MRTSGNAGIRAIECPACGSTLYDYDAPEIVQGGALVTARCHVCKTELALRIDSWRGETSVTTIRQAPWVQPGG